MDAFTKAKLQRQLSELVRTVKNHGDVLYYSVPETDSDGCFTGACWTVKITHQPKKEDYNGV